MDYPTLAARALVAPDDAELRAELVVCADARVADLEWRAGQLAGAWLDLRHVEARAGIAPVDVVRMLVTWPAGQTLRRLRIRITNLRTSRDARGDLLDILQLLGEQAQVPAPPPLEEIELGAGPYPRHGPCESSYVRDLLKFPNLYFAAIADRVATLPPPAEAPLYVELGRALFGTGRTSALVHLAASPALARRFARPLAVLLAGDPDAGARVVVSGLGAGTALSAHVPRRQFAIWRVVP
jgi:hypothetical protein